MPQTTTTIQWYGNKIISSTRRGLRGRLALISRVLSNRLKIMISVPVVKVGGKVVVRSLAGEPPRLDTGNLRRGIFGILVSDEEAWVGGQADYLKFLELGTVKMQPRPSL